MRLSKSITIIALVVVGLGLIYYFYNVNLKSFQSAFYSQKGGIVFYDSAGKPFYSLNRSEGRVYISIDQVSVALIKATVGIEDQRFFQHFGFDLPRIGQSLASWVKTGSPQAGASTITQQLAKVVVVGPERSLARKIKELWMALVLEVHYSKKQILEFYLNSIYFGKNSYGIEAAAENYFNKPALSLSLAEGAVLAGLIRRPEGYSPFVDTKATRNRQLLVLKKLLDLGWVSAEEYKQAVDEKVGIEPGFAHQELAPYFVFAVMPTLKEHFGDAAIAAGGFKVYTTLNRQTQIALEKAVRAELKPERIKAGVQVAGLVVESGTGHVLAMLGGLNFGVSQFNRATQANRQPGSSFKPFLYALALEKGLEPWSLLSDAPAVYPGGVEEDLLSVQPYYEPKNYSETSYGDIPLAFALQESSNLASVLLLHDLGVSAFQKFAEKFGFHLANKGLCLALGCQEVTLVQLVQGYSVFANQGRFCPISQVLQVVGQTGEVWQPDPSHCTEVLSEKHTIVLDSLLKNVIDLGTGKAAKLPYPAYGKTGTTNSNRDAWFVGFDSQRVAGIWLGKDDNSPLVFESGSADTGGRTPAKIWKNFMLQTYDPKAPPAEIVPSGYKKTSFCFSLSQDSGSPSEQNIPLVLPDSASPLDLCHLGLIPEGAPSPLL